MITCGIPIHNLAHYTRAMLNSLANNETKPQSVIIIDNASTDDSGLIPVQYTGKLPIHYVYNPTNIGVNPAWQKIFDLTPNEYVCVLNNDILLPTFYISSVIEQFDKNPDVGMLLPERLDVDALVLQAVPPSKVGLEDFNGREGWAFAVRRSVFKKFKDFPSNIILSAGDDFLFNECRKQGLRVCRMKGIPVKHYGSTTIRAMGGWDHLNRDMAPNDHFLWKEFQKKN